MTSALGRLVAIIRLGKENRNYADLMAVEWALAPEFVVSDRHLSAPGWGTKKSSRDSFDALKG
jgi:hypothetical protein